MSSANTPPPMSFAQIIKEHKKDAVAQRKKQGNVFDDNIFKKLQLALSVIEWTKRR